MTEMNETTKKRGVPIWIQIVIWAGLTGLLALVAFGLNRRQNPMAELNQPVPNFELVFYKDYEYNQTASLQLADLRGKIVLINIWASWCKPCEQEAADLEKAWQFYQPAGEVVFIGVDYVDTPAGAFQYLKKFNITFPNAPDLKSNISSILNRQMGVPETYLIDREGILRQIKIGPFTSQAEIQAFIAIAE